MTVGTRDEFVTGQAEMGRIWYENMLKSGVDVETYLAGRRAAYNDRWREAGRFIRPGSRVLDVGGGNLYPELLGYIKSKAWDYWFFDIGDGEVANSRKLAVSMGFEGSQFRQGLNHELSFEPNSFDAVFSSHCIEHSMNLKLTLSQINNILKPGGNLLMAVPFGWERNPNHPYFYLEDEWLALVEDSGFQIRIYQIGCEYPENGHDLFIAARKVGPPAASFRIEPENFLKTNFQFHDFTSPSVQYFGDRAPSDEYMVMNGSDWRIEIAPGPGWSEILPIFVRHNWSGIVQVRSSRDVFVGDLYRQNKAAQPVRLRLSAPTDPGQSVEISPVGRNEASFSHQAVFVGYMVR